MFPRPVHLLGFLLLLGWLIAGTCLPRASRTVLFAPGVAEVPVAVDRAALSTLAGADPDRALVFRAPSGSEVRVLGRSFGAVEIETDDGRRGWVFAEWVRDK